MKKIGWILIFIGGFLMGWGVGRSSACAPDKILLVVEKYIDRKNKNSGLTEIREELKP